MTLHTRHRLPLILAASLTLLGCVPASMPEPHEGAAYFAQNCASCHGASGQGDGPLAAGLNPAPVDLTRLRQGNGGTFPTARALSYVYGDPRGDHRARVMPEFGAAMDEDLVPIEVDGVLTPTPRPLAALLAYLVDIQR
ncbi:c-type cytochrome [Sulfitobacter aestuarii]|uniref:C-type cytochrome n=1 Tax=Sulfitobacter aestuarii TaxID=2161676 RepID=A0ABW5U0N7_9RHOB